MTQEHSGTSKLNPLGFGLVRRPLAGVQIQESVHATTLEQDWSGCRSPSRAKRRHARGIRTRMREWRKPACFRVGDVLVAHPEILRQLREHAAADMERRRDEMTFRTLFGKELVP